MSKQYDASDIDVLKGLEPVKLRPGMYTRTTDPTHIVQEVIDNAADEALGGHARDITVTVHPDKSISVEDDGRGIPVDLHPTEGVPAVQVIFTVLHSGGKFKKGEGGSYQFSGGLHGVGVSVTNALSTRLEVDVKRAGATHRIVFADGEVIEPLVRTGDCGPRTHGTRVRVWPDPKYFDASDVSVPQLERLLRSKAVLLPGVTVTLIVEKGTDNVVKTWKYENGLADYLNELIGDDEAVCPVFSGEKYVKESGDDFTAGEGAAWAFSWVSDGSGMGESYVNLIPTPLGGTHEGGLRAGVFEAVKAFVDHHALLPRGVKLQPEDVWARVRYVLSGRLLDPAFQGQTKDKLTSREAFKLVSSMVKDPLEIWLNSHVEAGKAIAELAVKQALARQKSAQKVEKKKSSGVAVLPGKLTDCESDDVAKREIYLVEGDSAGGSAKLARNRETQAILPLRGKIKNTFEVGRDQLFSNNEVHDISVAVGIDPHGLDDTIPWDQLRYDKVIIMSDADVDGSHIQCLLLTLFYTHFPQLLLRGHVYVAQPPLFKVDVAAGGKNRPARKFYALDETERDGILERLANEGVKDTAITIGRFKGLGEMNPDQLRETTMQEETRRLVQFRHTPEELAQCRALFTLLMGKEESGERKSWMAAKGGTVDADI